MTISVILWSIWAFLMLAIIYMWVRNDWVHKVRIANIDQPRYDELLSYNQMMLRFWVWDILKLKKETK